MPKIISRSQAFASNHDNEGPGLLVYYCLCGAHVLTSALSIEKMSRRQTDNSITVPMRNGVVRYRANEGASKVIKRAAGFEKQYRYHCAECGLPIYYAPQPQNPPFTYILDGAVTAGATQDLSVARLPGRTVLTTKRKRDMNDDEVDKEIQALLEGEQ
eukprot:c34404_g1_i1.p1 GENE.c34404_g1_i1~~c34404_g1_i1.p1  ORF type:complete len:158 (+),score=20.98 c34404_g1_i1:51-524(+)